MNTSGSARRLGVESLTIRRVVLPSSPAMKISPFEVPGAPGSLSW